MNKEIYDDTIDSCIFEGYPVGWIEWEVEEDGSLIVVACDDYKPKASELIRKLEKYFLGGKKFIKEEYC